MIVAITAQKKEVEGPVDERFGRARGFFLLDSSLGEYRYLDNAENIDQPQGVGVSAVQMLLKEKVEVLLTANVGPRAHYALSESGIKVYEVKGMSVAEAVKGWEDEKLTLLTAPNAESHAGL